MSTKSFEKLISQMFTMRRLFIDRLECSAVEKNQISVLHIEVLQLVADLPMLPMRHVAEHFCITPPSATSLVDGMVRDGLLKRAIDSRDRRVIRLVITPAGRRQLKQGQKAMEIRVRDFLSALSEPEVRKMTAIIEKLIATLKKSPIAKNS